MNPITILYILFLIFLIIQGVLVLYLSLYIWLDDERIQASASPEKFDKPDMTFTLMLPAYHEEAVLGETIKRVAWQNYPQDKFEMLIILQPSDVGTIEVAKAAITEAEIKNATILIVDGKHTPLNKPYQLNYALEKTNFEKLVIFDSEDDVHPDILNIANTLFRKNKHVDILQCGVQLMDYASTWFAAHNVLEYYFWFKSRMHAHMRIGAVPLGGNTVFFDTQQVRDIGGWNEGCLCEDADIGLRLSVNGSKMMASYDPRHITKEETPHTIAEFIKQRTRWCQGFIQILRFGDWKDLGTTLKVLMSLYLLGSPFLLVFMLFLGVLMMIIGLQSDLPFLVSILSFAPLFMVFITIAIQMAALAEFVYEHNMKFKPWVFIFFPITYAPYVIMLCIGAVRAVIREMKGMTNWEKTAHGGTHRKADA